MSLLDSPAFIANHLDRLAARISAQSEVMLKNAGIEFPARSVSAILLLGENSCLSIADIADQLGQPHQLVTQRVDFLVSTKLVDRIPDPEDGRRKILKLTKKGQEQFVLLENILTRSDHLFVALFREIDCNLMNIVKKAHEALDRASMSERIAGYHDISNTPHREGTHD